MMEALTAFDAVVIVVAIVSTLMALARGFMRELATLGAFIAALAAAYYANRFLNGAVAGLIPDSWPSWTPAAILIISTFLVVYVAVAWFGASLSKSIQGVDGISLVDRVAGGLFGLARGYVVLVFFVYLLNLAMDKDQIPEFISEAQTYPLIEAGATYLSDNAPAFGARMGGDDSLDDPGDDA
ncbi:MAG: CvpA family protein [Pseudomonadota bacterium]